MQTTFIEPLKSLKLFGDSCPRPGWIRLPLRASPGTCIPVSSPLESRDSWVWSPGAGSGPPRNRVPPTLLPCVWAFKSPSNENSESLPLFSFPFCHLSPSNQSPIYFGKIQINWLPEDFSGIKYVPSFVQSLPPHIPELLYILQNKLYTDWMAALIPLIPQPWQLNIVLLFFFFNTPI